MKLYQISLKSMRRRKAKTIFLIVSLVLSVASVVMLATVTGTVNQNIASDLDEFGANILILPNNDEVNISYGGFSVGGISYTDNKLTLDDIQKIETIKNKDNISIVSPKLFVVERIGTRNVVIVGVDFKKETKMKKWWRIFGTNPSSENEILIGANIKKKLNTGINKQIEVKGKSFFVAGIIEETGSQDDDVIFADLNIVQKLFNQKNNVSLVEVAALCYNCPIEEIVRQTSQKLPNAKVTAIRQTIDIRMAAVHRFEHFSLGIAGVILIITVLIVFTTVSNSVTERTREIGLFQALGFNQIDVIRIILIEVLLCSLIAGVMGYFFGFIGSKIIVPILSMKAEATVEIQYVLMLMSIGLSLFIALIASSVPSIRASRLYPIEAFRAL